MKEFFCVDAAVIKYLKKIKRRFKKMLTICLLFVYWNVIKDNNCVGLWKINISKTHTNLLNKKSKFCIDKE